MKTAKTVRIEPFNTPPTADKGQVNDPAPMMQRAPQPPDGMNEVAAEFWRKKTIHLRQIGRLHAIDLDALELMANLYSDIKKTRAMMDGTWNTDVFTRHQKTHNEALKLFKDLARDFGFTPSSRSKIKGGTAGAQADNEWNEI